MWFVFGSFWHTVGRRLQELTLPHLLSHFRPANVFIVHSVVILVLAHPRLSLTRRVQILAG